MRNLLLNHKNKIFIAATISIKIDNNSKRDYYKKRDYCNSLSERAYKYAVTMYIISRSIPNCKFLILYERRNKI